jgi:peptidoglycan/xylan/chitin deacetylase (PgdA/CDA1 family)
MRLKETVKNGVGLALGRSGFNTLAHTFVRGAGSGILIYHDPSAKVLDQHLTHLKKDYFIISLDELCDRIEKGVPFSDGPSLVVTIDDGHAGNHALVDIFHKHHVKPTIYICSAIVGTRRMFWWQHPAARSFGVETIKRMSGAKRAQFFARVGFSVDTEWSDRMALSLDQLRDLSDVASIQSHTRFHPILTHCTDNECQREIEESKHEIESITGRMCEHLSFPNGNYDARSIRFAKHAGYRSARTCDLGWNDHTTDLFKLKGIPVADDASLNWLDVQLTQFPTYLRYSRRGSFNGKFPQF